MEDVDLLILYEANGHKYIQVNGFYKNQTVNEDREAPSEIPEPTQEQLQSRTRVTPAKVKLKLSKVNISKSAFNEIWGKYPKRVGRRNAEKHFYATVKTEEDLKAIHQALDNYLKSERVYKGYIQNGSTWFNNWRDWVDYKETVCQQCHGKGKYTSTTGYEVFCDCPKGKARQGEVS